MRNVIHRPSPAVLERAIALHRSGRFAEALPLYHEALVADPRSAPANQAVGMEALLAGDHVRAVEHLQRAAAAAPKDGFVQGHYGSALLMNGQAKKAVAVLEKAVRLTRGAAPVLAHLGDGYRMLRQPAKARSAYRRALEADPENGGALVGLGQVELALGDRSAAETAFRRAIALKKALPTAYFKLAGLQRHNTVPPELAEIETLIAKLEPEGPSQAVADLHWAAGKILDDLGEVDRAMPHFDASRAMAHPPYDIDRYRAFVAAMSRHFDAAYFESHRSVGVDSERPVFVFGMPRSGTTLVEQIIARHPQAAGAGELPFFHALHRSVGFEHGTPDAYIAAIQSLTSGDLRTFSRRYLAQLEAIGGKARRVVDKLPHNFEALWLLAILFPKATFIHCRREPLDTCVSILTSPLGRDHDYSRDQPTLGAYYRQYETLMAHWRRVLPIEIREQSYEALVERPDKEIPALIEQVGLPWNDACLDPSKGRDMVTTLSQVQVRQPIYRTAIARWRRYGKHIGPLIEVLGNPEDRGGQT